jgi:integrase
MLSSLEVQMANQGRITMARPLPLEVVARIKALLRESPRELAWFLLSVNSAFRGGDILRIRRADLRPLPGGRLEITLRERKTRQLRTVTVNAEVATAVSRWLSVHPKVTEFLFEGSRGQMGTSYWAVLLRKWCAAVGYDEERTSTHSCRKTFARVNFERGAKVETLMVALRHSSPSQTLTYINVLPEEVEALYERGI